MLSWQGLFSENKERLITNAITMLIAHEGIYAKIIMLDKGIGKKFISY